LELSGGRGAAVAADERATREAVQELAARPGRIDVLVMVTSAALTYMIAQRSGVVVNVASAVGTVGCGRARASHNSDQPGR
jgi:NAD(P)-dependent dehydrogenase (short-subunit alcohol dehydrogenase family)